MSTFFQFALLGIGAGGAYAIAGLGLVQAYRGSGVLNLAHGAVALLAAVMYQTARTRWGWGFAPATALALLGAVSVGAMIQLLVMRPLRSAAVLVRMTATLGVFAIIQAGVPAVFGSGFDQLTAPSFYPEGRVNFGQGVVLPYDRLIVVAVSVIVGIALWIVSRRTRFGLSTTASAESAVVSASMAINPNRLALVNWTIGSGLAGLAGVLLLPIIGVVTEVPFLFLIVPALAAGMIARFRFFSLTIAGGLAIGVGQSLLTRYESVIFPQNLSTGWPDALPFLVIVGILVFGGSPFPARSDPASRLPRLGRSGVHPLVILVLCVVGIAVTQSLSANLATAVAAAAALGIVGLSLVVITGLAGQVSLGQMAIAGVAALIAVRISANLGWPFPACTVIGVAGGSLVGFLFAAPAVRTRGPTLAVATLGIGLAIEEIVLNNGWFTGGGFTGTPIHAPTLGSLSIDGESHSQRYAAVALVALVLTAHAVANLRSGPVGRRLIAIRNSERASAASAIPLARTKTAAFVLSAAVASLGGILLAFRVDSVNFGQFGLVYSLSLVIFTLIGGVGYVIGPIVGALGSPTGLASLFNQQSSLEEWIVVLSGFTLIFTLVFFPDGLVAFLPRAFWRRWTEGSAKREDRTEGSTSVVSGSEPNRLEIANLSVSYGKVLAVSDVSVTVDPGQIVGLIGPNGAGKTTIIDAVTGFIRPTKGCVRLGNTDLTRSSVDQRARDGLARSFQTVELFHDLTVAENIAVACDRVRWYDWVGDLLRRKPAKLDPLILTEAASFGLDLDALPDSLSQGRRRMLGVLRALAARPSVLLLDEPAAGLDADETRQLGEVLRTVARERQIGLLLVEHDMSLVSAICDYVVVLDFGLTIFSGPAADAFRSPDVRSAYLGDIGIDEEPTADLATGGHRIP